MPIYKVVLSADLAEISKDKEWDYEENGCKKEK